MLTIKDLSASQGLDRAAMSAVTGGLGVPSFFQFNYANDLYDFLGSAYQADVTTIGNFGNNGSAVYNVVNNEKVVNV